MNETLCFIAFLRRKDTSKNRRSRRCAYSKRRNSCCASSWCSLHTSFQKFVMSSLFVGPSLVRLFPDAILFFLSVWQFSFVPARIFQASSGLLHIIYFFQDLCLSQRAFIPSQNSTHLHYVSSESKRIYCPSQGMRINIYLSKFPLSSSRLCPATRNYFSKTTQAVFFQQFPPVSCYSPYLAPTLDLRSIAPMYLRKRL